MDYVNNEELLKLVTAYVMSYRKWKDQIKKGLDVERPPLSEELCNMIILIIDNYLHKYSFRGYEKSIKEDMKGHALVNVLKYIHNFDFEKYSNPFSYITQIVHNSFLQIINKENMEREKKFLLQGIENEFYKKKEKPKVEDEENLIYQKIDDEN